MKSPGDKIDPADYDDVATYIAEAMAEGYTIEADDFEGRPCAYCGEVIPFADWPQNVVTWDTPVVDPETGEKDPFIHRDYFCSEDCRSAAKHDGEWIQNVNGRRCDDGDRIRKENISMQGGQ